MMHQQFRSMAGLMGVTAFLSMWINNSAAASIMLPVALAITSELESHTRAYHEKQSALQNSTITTNNDRNEQLSTEETPHMNETHSIDVLDLTKVDMQIASVAHQTYVNNTDSTYLCPNK
jgi:di/tricarboxylate transporter